MTRISRRLTTPALALLVLAGAFGAVGAAIGTMAWNELHDRSRGGR